MYYGTLGNGTLGEVIHGITPCGTTNRTALRPASILLGLIWFAPCRGSAESPDFAARFDQIHKIVATDFFDANLRGLDWQAVGVQFRREAAEATDREAFAAIVNRMLATLQSSHTKYFVPEMPQYYELLGVFETSGAYAERSPRGAARRAGTRSATSGSESTR